MALSSGSPPSHLLPVLCSSAAGQGGPGAQVARLKAAPVPGDRADPATSRTHWVPHATPQTQKKIYIINARSSSIPSCPDHPSCSPCLAQGPPSTLGSVLLQGLCTAVTSSPRAFARLPQMHPSIPPISHPDVSTAPGLLAPRDSFELNSPPDRRLHGRMCYH